MSHPDYLGHTEFVSDANGDAYQYFWYSPFGDAIVEEHANTASFSSRYLFNAKELDPETGRYYYGARYYDPGLSIWLSVDPLAKEFPHVSPYNFVENNPIILYDPDGRGPVLGDNRKTSTNPNKDAENGNEVARAMGDDPKPMPKRIPESQSNVDPKPNPESIQDENRLGSLGIGLNFEISFPGSAFSDDEPKGLGMSVDLMADAESNLDLFLTTKTPDGAARKDQFGFSLDLQFSITTGTNGNANPLNAQLEGPGSEWGAGGGPFGYSLTTNKTRTYNMHTVPIFGQGVDAGLTNWRTNTTKILSF